MEYLVVEGGREIREEKLIVLEVQRFCEDLYTPPTPSGETVREMREARRTLTCATHFFPSAAEIKIWKNSLQSKSYMGPFCCYPVTRPQVLMV